MSSKSSLLCLHVEQCCRQANSLVPGWVQVRQAAEQQVPHFTAYVTEVPLQHKEFTVKAHGEQRWAPRLLALAWGALEQPAFVAFRGCAAGLASARVKQEHAGAT